MSNRIVTSYQAMQLTPATRGSLLACGLWMRAAFIGASATAIGVIQLFEGDWSATSALFTAVAGVALTLLSYRRARAALSDAGERATASGATPAAAHH